MGVEELDYVDFRPDSTNWSAITQLRACAHARPCARAWHEMPAPVAVRTHGHRLNPDRAREFEHPVSARARRAARSAPGLIRLTQAEHVVDDVRLAVDHLMDHQSKNAHLW